MREAENQLQRSIPNNIETEGYLLRKAIIQCNNRNHEGARVILDKALDKHRETTASRLVHLESMKSGVYTNNAVEYINQPLEEALHIVPIAEARLLGRNIAENDDENIFRIHEPLNLLQVVNQNNENHRNVANIVGVGNLQQNNANRNNNNNHHLGAQQQQEIHLDHIADDDVVNNNPMVRAVHDEMNNYHAQFEQAYNMILGIVAENE